MDFSFLQTALEELAKKSPSAMIILGIMVFTWMIHRSSTKQMKDLYQKTIEEIRESHKIAFDETRKTYDLISKQHGELTKTDNKK